MDLNHSRAPDGIPSPDGAPRHTFVGHQTRTSSRLAESTWWWALRGNRVFLTDEYFLDRPSVTLPGLPAQGLALLRTLRPDYVLLDSAIGCQSQATRPWFGLQAAVGEFCRPMGRLQGAQLDDVGLGFSVVGQRTTVFRCSYP